MPTTKEVVSLILSIVGDVVAHYVIKWLDGEEN